jgi:hypothetical protein
MEKIRQNWLNSIENVLLVIIAIVLILLAGLRPYGFDIDSANYYLIIQRIVSANNAIPFENLGFLFVIEPGMWMIVLLASMLFSNPYFGTIFLFAVFGVSLKVLAMKRLSLYPLLSVYLYACSFFLIQEMTQIRQGMASAFFLLAIPDIYKRNAWGYYFKIFCAFMFHYVAILAIPLYILRAKEIRVKLFAVFPIVAISLLLFKDTTISVVLWFLHLLPQFVSQKPEYYITNYLNGAQKTPIIISYLNLSYIIIYYLAILNVKKLKGVYDLLFVKLLGISFLFYYGFSFVPDVASRSADLLSQGIIILIPNLIAIFRQKALIIIIVLAYGLFMVKMLEWILQYGGLL